MIMVLIPRSMTVAVVVITAVIIVVTIGPRAGMVVARIAVTVVVIKMVETSTTHTCPGRASNTSATAST
jgi:hypothetical protein